MACAAWGAAAAAAFLGLAPLGLAGGDALGCGMLAPFSTACQDCCAELGPAPEIQANLLGYVGSLEVRLEGVQGAWVWWCWTVVFDEPLPVPVEQCSGPVSDGVPPAAGDTVALSCYARPLEQGEGLVGPAGPWGCQGYP